MSRVSILGLGLMGGSLGLALKARGFGGEVVGYTRSPERRTIALRRGAVDAVFPTAREAVKDADIVVLCGPILVIPRLVRETLPALKRGAILTDVGSTKGFLVREIDRLTRGMSITFVGSHPIAGSEQQGIESAREDLYGGAVVVVTPGKKTKKAAVRKVEELWRSVGAVVRRMDPEVHDKVLARTSHLPHLAAALVASSVGRGRDVAKVGPFCGSGFRDTTRVAEGGTEIWGDILKTNGPAVVQELMVFRDEVEALIDALDRGHFADVNRILERGRTARRALLDKRSKSLGEGMGT